jgi:hypothetical protein
MFASLQLLLPIGTADGGVLALNAKVGGHPDRIEALARRDLHISSR